MDLKTNVENKYPKLGTEEINIKLTVSSHIKKHLGLSYKEMRDELDRKVFKYCLDRYKNNFSRVAVELDISRNTLFKRVKELNIER